MIGIVFITIPFSVFPETPASKVGTNTETISKKEEKSSEKIEPVIDLNDSSVRTKSGARLPSFILKDNSQKAAKTGFERKMEQTLLTLKPESVKALSAIPDYEQTPWFASLKKAHIALFFKQLTDAQNYYMDTLKYPMPSIARQLILLEMGDVLYNQPDMSIKVATIYETFLNEFPKHPEAPEIYLKLGRIYRSLGVYDLAITKFYNIINLSLGIDEKEIDRYKKLILSAQFEIAETLFQKNNFSDALHTLSRIKQADLSLEDKEHIDFLISYCQFNLENYEAAAISLESLIKKYPNANFIPESMFLLANVYKQLKRPNDAVSEVIKLLQVQEFASDQKETWLYWQKRAANQIANDLYEQSDFINAIKIYQTLIPINNDPTWQWPVIYQIGLCFERLKQLDRAKEAYQILIAGKEWKDVPISPAMKSLQETARWRLNHIDWSIKTEVGIHKLLAPPSAFAQNSPSLSNLLKH